VRRAKDDSPRRDGRDHRGNALGAHLAVWTQDTDFDVLRELAPELRVHPA